MKQDIELGYITSNIRGGQSLQELRIVQQNQNCVQLYPELTALFVTISGHLDMEPSIVSRKKCHKGSAHLPLVALPIAPECT